MVGKLYKKAGIAACAVALGAMVGCAPGVAGALPAQEPAEQYAAEHPTPADVGTYGDGVELGEVYDPSQPIAYLDSDDFESLDQYRTYLRSKGLSDPTVGRAPALGVKASTVTASGLYRFDLPEGRDHAIQSFAVTSSCIYISQVYKYVTLDGVKYDLTEEQKKEGKIGNFVLISRCTRNASTGAYEPKDWMLISGAGHGQTLDVFTHNGKDYLLVSGGQYWPKGSEKPWSTQIARVEYKPGAVVANSSMKRLNYLKYSNKSGTSFGGIKRADAALSSDGKALLIWKRSTSNADEFSAYDLETVNKVLDQSPANAVSFENNSTLRKACEFSFREPANMPSSVQGVELSNKSGTARSIYVASGTEDNKGAGNYLYRFNSNGNYRKAIKLSDKGVWKLYGDSATKDTTAEVEGVKISGSNLRFVLRDAANPSRQVLAQVDKDKLK